jgi:hypothetical protein
MMSSWFHKLAQPFQREPRITLQKFSRTRVGILIVQNIASHCRSLSLHSLVSGMPIASIIAMITCLSVAIFDGRPSAGVGMKIVACAIPAWQELRGVSHPLPFALRDALAILVDMMRPATLRLYQIGRQADQVPAFL